MRQEWVGLKIPVGSKKARKALSPNIASYLSPTQKPKNHCNYLSGSRLGESALAWFVKALISRNQLGYRSWGPWERASVSPSLPTVTQPSTTQPYLVLQHLLTGASVSTSEVGRLPYMTAGTHEALDTLFLGGSGTDRKSTEETGWRRSRTPGWAGSRLEL